jgi:hypothetical protein
MVYSPQYAGRSRFLAAWLTALGIALLLPAPAIQAQVPSVPSGAAKQPQTTGASKKQAAQAAEKKGTGEEKASEETAQKPAVDQPKRLILKDGSYQATVRWEDKGDRIRYLSAERYQWEEIPKDLIDWDATEKYYRKSHPTKEMKAAAEAKAKAEATAEEEEQRRTDSELDQTNPEVAPGLRLPDGKGVYLFDVFRSQPQLAELVQNSGEIKADRGKNILRAAINPLAKNKQKIELDGTRARIHAHIPDPVIYLNIDEEAAGDGGDLSQRFQIARMKVEKRSRVVGVIEFAFYSGTSQKADIVPAKVTRVGDSWVKVQPSGKLDPGEYAVVEMIGKDVNLFVWDFGVDPTAPENPPKWVPPPSDKDKKKDDRSLFRKILGIPADPQDEQP